LYHFCTIFVSFYLILQRTSESEPNKREKKGNEPPNNARKCEKPSRRTREIEPKLNRKRDKMQENAGNRTCIAGDRVIRSGHDRKKLIEICPFSSFFMGKPPRRAKGNTAMVMMNIYQSFDDEYISII